MKINAIVIDPKDNVAVVTEEIRKGGTIRTAGRELPALEDIPSRHKAAIEPIESGGRVVRYGQCVGRATRLIEAGQWVHTHNIEAEEG